MKKFYDYLFLTKEQRQFKMILGNDYKLNKKKTHIELQNQIRNLGYVRDVFGKWYLPDSTSICCGPLPKKFVKQPDDICCGIEPPNFNKTAMSMYNEKQSHQE
jgi:hypothetical protein